MSHSLQILFAPDPIPAEAPNPAANRPGSPPRLRLVEKSAKDAIASPQVQQDKAAEAAARVAARFAAMPRYGSPPRAASALDGMLTPAQTVKPLGWLTEQQADHQKAEPADAITKLMTKPVQLTGKEEEKEAMNSNTFAGSENSQQAEPLNRSLVARRLRQQGININGTVQLSIFEAEPAEYAVEEPVATPSVAAISTPVYHCDATAVVEPAVRYTPSYVDEMPERELVSAVSSWPSSSELIPHVSEAEVFHVEQALEAAPFARRFMSGCVDLCLILVASSVTMVLALNFAPEILLGSGAFGKLMQGLLIVALVYSLLFAVLLRVTPGQVFASLRVVQLDGKKAGFLKRVLRQLLMPLSIAPLGLGLFWNLVDPRRLCWHDRFSGTLPKSYY